MTNDELKRLAEQATPGPWLHDKFGDEPWFTVLARDVPAPCVAENLSQADAAYIAAASPDVVMGLIAEVEVLTRMIDEGLGWQDMLNDIGAKP